MRKMLFMAVVAAVFAAGVCKSETAKGQNAKEANDTIWCALYCNDDKILDKNETARIRKHVESFVRSTRQTSEEFLRGDYSETIMLQSMFSLSCGIKYNLLVMDCPLSGRLLAIINPPQDIFGDKVSRTEGLAVPTSEDILHYLYMESIERCKAGQTNVYIEPIGIYALLSNHDRS